MAVGQSETSKISVTTTGTGRSKIKKYTATKVIQGIDSSGNPTFTKEIIKYSDANGNNPVVIGNINPGETKITPTSNATRADSLSLKQGGSLQKASQQQADSILKNFNTNAEEKDKFNKANQSPNKAKTEEETGDNSQPAAQTEPPAPDKTRNNFPKNLIYPSDIGQSKQDIIKFNMVKYEPKKFSGVGFAARRSVSSENIIGSVILPVPGGITDTNAVSWGSEKMNPLEAATSALALGFISKGSKGATDAAGAIAESVSAGREDIKTAIAAAFAGAATGTGAQLLTRTTGAIINPNMELLFQAPTLRPFNFTFKLSPRNSDEAKEVIRIIRFFKQGMSPITTPSNLFLKSPHTFKIQYKLRNDKEHPYIGKIKECALTGFTVDYTPDGNYATFEDGVMTSYQISMTFQELEPVFNSDYTELDNNGDTEIGY